MEHQQVEMIRVTVLTVHQKYVKRGEVYMFYLHQ